jgi:hypothetical protein
MNTNEQDKNNFLHSLGLKKKPPYKVRWLNIFGINEYNYCLTTHTFTLPVTSG